MCEVMVPVLRRLASAMKADKVSVGPLSAHYASCPTRVRTTPGGRSGHGSPGERRQQVPADVGRAQPVRRRRERISAERRLQSDRPLGGLIYWTVDALKNRYLKHPGPLVS